MPLPALLVRTTANRRLQLLLAGVLLGLLLVAFQQVVAGSVERGEVLRKSANTQADAAWRCRLPGSASPDAACRAPGSREGTHSVNAFEPGPVALGSPR